MSIATPQRPEESLVRPIRVLLVDDDRLVRQGLRGILAGAAGIEVIGDAANGAEAVAFARERRPDIVMMDVRMPGVSGSEATVALLQAVPSARVIAITSFDAEDALLQMIEAGALGFLLKDAPAIDFATAIRSVHAGEGFVSPRSTAHLIARLARGRDHAARREAQRRFATLTARERDIAVLVAEGAANGDIARELHLSLATVKTHLEQARIKLGARNRALMCIAVERAGFGPDGP